MNAVRGALRSRPGTLLVPVPCGPRPTASPRGVQGAEHPDTLTTWSHLAHWGRKAAVGPE